MLLSKPLIRLQFSPPYFSRAYTSSSTGKKHPFVSQQGIQNKVIARNLVDSISNSLNIKQLSDWYNVSPSEFSEKIRGENFSEFSHKLPMIYPEHKFLPWKFKYKGDFDWNSLE